MPYKNKEEYLQYQKEYREKNRDILKVNNREYYKKNSEHIKQYQKEYRKTYPEKLKQRKKEYYFNNKEKIKQYKIVNKERIAYMHKLYLRKWHNTEKGINWKIRQKSKKRNLGFFKLFNNPFPKNIDIHWHHINNLFIVPIPKKIHEKCNHISRDEHRERCNLWLYYLYGIDFKILLGE